jgi:hypothetical protein
MPALLFWFYVDHLVDISDQPFAFSGEVADYIMATSVLSTLVNLDLCLGRSDLEKDIIMDRFDDPILL